ncbi:Protein Mpv17 [Dirofilaria immitis]
MSYYFVLLTFCYEKKNENIALFIVYHILKFKSPFINESPYLCFFLRMLLAIYRAYEKALAKYPFLTQASSAGALAAIADMLTQNFIEKRWQKGEYSPARTIRFSAIILFWIAPVTYRWFLLLEKLKGNANLLPLKRMILDQSLAAPLFTFSFITNLRILEGNSPGLAIGTAYKFLSVTTSL